MAFIKQGSKVLSFATFDDVQSTDLRLLGENESLTEDLVEEALVKATTRILDQLRASEWWKEYFTKRNPNTPLVDIPSLNASLIIARTQTFTDLCVAMALAEYALPSVADFSNESNAELVKITFYRERAVKLFAELTEAGDWYDYNNDKSITSADKQPSIYVQKRIR